VSRRLTPSAVRTVLAVLVVVVTSLGVGIASYAAHLRTKATALIVSAREIRTTADAEREIDGWNQREGKEFWTESDHPGGDHTYDGQIVNLPIARLRVVEPTVVTVGVTMRDGKLRSVTVIESTGWYPVASVWIQEWFDPDVPKRFHVASKDRPSVAYVEFPSSLPDTPRRMAFALNTRCLVRLGGCRNADDILPGVWKLETGSKYEPPG
jgi:hypothetical protein